MNQQFEHKVMVMREKAEVLLKKKPTFRTRPSAEVDALQMEHDLAIHQIELEMMNDELIVAKEKAEGEAQKYSDLYNFAPSGYYTLSENGYILTLNLFGSQLLGKDRSFLIGKRIEAFMTDESRFVFHDFLEKIFTEKTSETCDVEISDGENAVTFLQMRGIIAYNGLQCLVSASDISASKSNETKLQLASEHWSSTFDAIGDSIFLLDENRKIIECNLAFLDFIGKKNRDEVIGMTCWQILNTAMCAEDKCPFNCILKSKKRETSELQLGEAYYRVMVDPIFDENKTIIGAVHIISDITQSKQIENSLREKEVQYMNLANAGLAMVWASDTNENCTYFNQIWLNFTGRTLAQELDKGWADGIHPDDFAYCVDIYTKAFTLRESFEMEFRLRHNSGEYRWVLDLGTPNYDSNKEFIGYIGHSLDITKRKKIESALIKSEEKYRNIFENVQDVFYQIDLQGKILDVSPSIKAFSDYDRDEVIGHSASDAYHNASDRETLLKVLLEHGELKDYELTVKAKDGSLRYASVNVRLVKDKQGNPIRIDGALRDISERRKIEMVERKKIEDQLVFGRLTVNRENKMVELKKEINELLKELNRDEKYDIFD
ncbi:MAG: PAS domain S-box protein [Bacteroidota bacterium]